MCNQGKVQLWVDIVGEEEQRDFPPVDIRLPPPETLEVRVVVWKCKDVPPQDLSGQVDAHTRIVTFIISSYNLFSPLIHRLHHWRLAFSPLITSSLLL